MKRSIYPIVLAFVAISSILIFCGAILHTSSVEDRIISHVVDLNEQTLKLYWKDTTGNIYNTFGKLQKSLEKEGKDLVFAMNGGMFNKDYAPTGLYIENGKTLKKINTNKKGYGNFHLQPNGVFYIDKQNKAKVCKTDDFNSTNALYATQSGPMLVVDGKVNSILTKSSKNVHIRNGVGIMPNGNMLFAISTELINFYDFANFFKSKGCKNALYLDGFVSQIYLPEKGYKQANGKCGVIIGETKDK